MPSCLPGYKDTSETHQKSYFGIRAPESSVPDCDYVSATENPQPSLHAALLQPHQMSHMQQAVLFGQSSCANPSCRVQPALAARTILVHIVGDRDTSPEKYTLAARSESPCYLERRWFDFRVLSEFPASAQKNLV